MNKEQMIVLLQDYGKNKYSLYQAKKEYNKLEQYKYEYNIRIGSNLEINSDIRPKNKTSDKVASAVIDLEKQKEINKAKMQELELVIKELEDKIEEVNQFLNALYDYERFAIENYYMKKRTQYNIGEKIFLEEFGMQRSEKTIKNIIKKAFKRLGIENST